jgi:hypothetical protein
MKMRLLQKGISVAALIGTLTASSVAQTLFDDFEPPTYVPGILTGQNSWYNPVPASSTDWSVYLYASNPLGIGANPGGATQMIAAVKDTSGFFPRAQKDFAWNQRTAWLVSYDVYVSFDATFGDNYDNIGSFSLQPSGATTKYFIDLFQWVTPTTTEQVGNPNDGWRMTWVVSDSGGSNQWIVSFNPPNPFHGLQINKWYRRFVAFDFDAGHVVKVGVRDLATGETWATPVGPTADFPYWYLINYTSGAIPTAFRFFVGGGTGADQGNMLAVDNIAFTAFSPGDVNMDGCVDDADLLEVLFAFGNTGAFLTADVNGDGTVDDADLLEVLFAFGSGC